MNPLCILRLGPVEAEVLDALEGGLWRAFGCDITRLDGQQEPIFAFDRERQQYNSHMVLREVAASLPRDAARLLAVTGVDLFIPMLSFVFGQAQVGGAAALISVARLRQDFYGVHPNPRLTCLRAVKEGIHEIGHTLGLPHCSDRRCPMSLSNSIRQVDEKSDELCGNCSIRMQVVLKSLRAGEPPAGVLENIR